MFLRSATTTAITTPINKRTEIKLRAADASPGGVTFSIVIGNATGTRRTVPLIAAATDDAYLATFYWTPESGDTLLEYHAEDGAGARSVLTPDVVMCNCLNAVMCDIATIKVRTSQRNDDKGWYIVGRFLVNCHHTDYVFHIVP